MTDEIDRLEAITGSSLRLCRPPQFSLHFRAELPAFNVIGSGGPNPIALKFRCKNVLRRRSSGSTENSKTSFSSTWKIRHPEMRPGGRICVPILYEGDWARAALISLVFVVHGKKSQRVAYSKGEILLVDDVCEDRFTILMPPRDEKASEDLKVPVLIHLLMDVWDTDAKNVSIRNAKRRSLTDVPKRVAGVVNKESRLMFQRIESISSEVDECTWPDSTDFLIEIPIQDIESQDAARKGPCQCDADCKFDENANLVLPPEEPRPKKRYVQFFCHQSKLAQESAVFEEMFRGDWTKDANVLRIRTFSPWAVEMFLNFIYYDQLRPIDSDERSDGDSRIDFNQIIQVVSLAKRYEIERLRSYCDSLLTDRYLHLACSSETLLLAERYELPLLGQAALSLLSWSLDEEYWKPLVCEEGKHLLNEVVREARRKHMFCTVINPMPLNPY